MSTHFLVLLCFAALFAGCGVKPVTVVDEIRFDQMAKRMTRELQARHILTSDRSRIFAFSFDSFKDYGDTLFHRLSPSFIFGDSGHVYPGKTFAATMQPESRVQHNANGFSINHPTQKLDLNMIAVVDWNDDGEKEWLVSCLVEPKRGGLTRTYYVLVPPPRDGTERLEGTVAAIYECLGLACNLYVRDSKSITRAAADPLALPTEVQDLMPGLQPVTTPPDKKPTKNKSRLEERSL
ncbi:MAG: hypothetical protein LBS77_02730 [Desulfovibrio sp.]|jgi:hypothetical protein|nr:hypothetical protein [Desulfovibrio sp.]